jgi:hypothetical protein
MAQFTYTGDSPRTFPDHGLEVEPGDVVDLDENPDPHYFEASTPKAAKAAKSS